MGNEERMQREPGLRQTGRIVLSKRVGSAIRNALVKLWGNEMRSNDHCWLVRRRRPSMISLPSRILTFGCSGWLILAPLGHLAAQDSSSGEVAPTTQPAAGDVTPPGQPLPDNSSAANPELQTPANSPTPTLPLLPQQATNPFLLSPSSTSSVSSQAPQLTAPSLYTTGANDLSQIATTAGLTQAFGSGAAAGFASEGGGMDYSHGPFGQIRLGPVELQAALLMNAVSDDNLRDGGQTSGKNGDQSAGKTSDTSFSVTPAILLDYGSQEGQKGYASIVYSPTLTRFLHYSQNNSDDQNVALNVQYPFEKLTLSFSQTYAQSTGINQDLNSRTTQTSSLTTFGGSYELDDKLSFSSSFQEAVSSFSQGAGQGDQASSVNSSLSYHLSEKMALVSSVNVGLDKPDNAGQETFEQALIGVSYQPTVKISASAQAGAEFRQDSGNDSGSQNGEEGSSVNPVFSLNLGYTPFDSTSLSLTAAQSVRSSSADSSQTAVTTDVGVSVTQRFVQRVYLSLGIDYSHNQYQGGNATNPNAGINTSGSSQDDLSYLASLSFAPTTWTSVAVYYQYQDNESDAAGQTYYDNEIGVSASVQF